jgi:hypothetical protein
MATVALLLVCFTAGFILELLLIYEGCKGAHYKTFKCPKSSSTTAVWSCMSHLRPACLHGYPYLNS